jgi:hypothetical protein
MAAAVTAKVLALLPQDIKVKQGWGTQAGWHGSAGILFTWSAPKLDD